MLCHENQREAEDLARGPVNRYLKSLVDAASDWTSGARSVDYPSYDQVIAALARETFETQVEKCAAWARRRNAFSTRSPPIVRNRRVWRSRPCINDLPLAAPRRRCACSENVLPRLD